MRHGFNTEIAVKYGVHAAIILDNLYFWIQKNKENGRNFREGRYWTYNSKKALAESFPYLTARQIDYAMKKLVEDGIVITGNYNESGYDRTLWYALTDFGYSILQNCEMDKTELSNGDNKSVKSIQQNCEMESTNLLNPFDEIVKPIPDSKPYSNPDSDNVFIVVSAGEEEAQAMSLEVGAAKAADNHPTHSQEIIYCDEVPTTARELQKAEALITSLFQQYRKNPTPSENDVKKAFKRVYRRDELPSGEAIGIYDAQKAELLAAAFEIAADGSNGGTPWNYIAGIYNNWEKNGVDSLEKLEQHEYTRRREQSKEFIDRFYGSDNLCEI